MLVGSIFSTYLIHKVQDTRSTDIVCLSEEHLLVSSGPPDFPFGEIHALAQVPASFNLTSPFLRIFVVNELHLDRPCVDEQVSA
jgi:hypothetical protein